MMTPSVTWNLELDNQGKVLCQWPNQTPRKQILDLNSLFFPSRREQN